LIIEDKKAQWVDYKLYDEHVFDDALFFARHLKSLRFVKVRSSPVSIVGLRDKLQIDKLSKLEHLDVCGSDVDAAALAQLKILPQLNVLDISKISSEKGIRKV